MNQNKRLNIKKTPKFLNVTLGIYISLFVVLTIMGTYLFIKKNVFTLVNPLNKVHKFYLENDYKKVINEANIILHKDPNSITLRRYIWKSKLFLGKFDESIKILEEMKDLNTSSIEINLGLCTVYRFKKDLDKTLKYCQMVLKENHMNETAKEQIIQAYVDKKMYDEAILYINKISKNYKESLKREILKSNILSLKGDYKKSIKLLEEAKSFYVNPTPTYYYLGKNYYKIKKYKKAAKNLEKFIKETKGKQIDVKLLENSYISLAKTYEKANLIDKAYQSYIKTACLIKKLKKINSLNSIKTKIKKLTKKEETEIKNDINKECKSGS
jgi:tetratricopeptide (TPR) repeat protein